MYLGSVISIPKVMSSDAPITLKRPLRFSPKLEIELRIYSNTNYKLRLVRPSVLSILLYVSSSWQVTLTFTQNFQGFNNSYLRHVIGIFWAKTITNEELSRRMGLPIFLHFPVCQTRRLHWFYFSSVFTSTSCPSFTSLLGVDSFVVLRVTLSLIEFLIDTVDINIEADT